MKVNSGAKVANLNADKLDGMDAGQLQGFRTVQVRSADFDAPAFQNRDGLATCQPGEQPISGSVALLKGETNRITYTQPGGVPLTDATGKFTGWYVQWYPEVDSAVRVYVVCAS